MESEPPAESDDLDSENPSCGATSVMLIPMSQGNLPYLQKVVRWVIEHNGQAVTQAAYEAAREQFPKAPSMKELLAWDRQSPPPAPKT